MASNNWALLVAGSSGYGNYRHQADVCHAYQILRAHGIPDDHIVVMMYDDIAYNYQNPDQGKIYNKPNGPDVYTGVLKDYTGSEVNPTNFLRILRGDKAGMAGIGSGKVIQSGPGDYVFINMVDHGAYGAFSFPNNLMLYAHELEKTIEKMHKNKQFNQMVIYMEACESGSMFMNYPDDWKVYATTAANPYESSYACYWDRTIGAYLGDEYSVSWMENTDENGTNTETLEQQYEIVKEETAHSHVSKYGDMSFNSELIGAFMGSKNPAPQKPGKRYDDSVPTFDATIVVLTKHITECKGEQQKKILELQLQRELQDRQEVRAVVERIVVSVAGNRAGAMEKAYGPAMELTQHECRKVVIDKFLERCPKVDYAIKQATVLSNLCEMGYPQDEIMRAISAVFQ